MNWMPVSDGYRRPGMTCNDRRLCMVIGEHAPHSHYVWAINMFWAAWGDVHGR